MKKILFATLGVTPSGAAAGPETTRRCASRATHLSPAVRESELRPGLYPLPPDLSAAAGDSEAEAADRRRFWIVKHGIKGSGMPAWTKGGMDDEAIRDLVAFLKVLPGMAPPAYRALVAASDGPVHAGIGPAEQGRQSGREASPQRPHAGAHGGTHGQHRH